MNPKIAAIAHSKHRNMIGLVGIEVDTEQKKAYVRLAKQWSREIINRIPYEIGQHYKKIHWNQTFIDQQTGQHFIQDLKRQAIPLKIISTQKNLKDPDDIERIRTMDKIEMVQLMISLRKNHQIVFPATPTETMRDLEMQMAIFSEHKTEAGNVDYYAPGDSFDNLTKGLLISCFASRKYLTAGHSASAIVGQVTETPEINYKIGFH